MTTIDPNARLAAAIRSQLAAVRGRAAGRAAEGSASSQRTPGRLSPALAQRIQAIDPQQPDAARQAVRIYLESELTREFGARLLGDPSFPQMLDAVQQRMGEDPDLAAAAEALGRFLLAPGSSSR